MDETSKGTVLSGKVIILKDKGKQIINEDDIRFLNDSFEVSFRESNHQSLLSKVFYIIKVLIYNIIVYCKTKCSVGKNVNELLIISPPPFRFDACDYYKWMNEYDSRLIRFLMIEEGIGTYIRGGNRWRARGLEGENEIKKKTKMIIRRINHRITNGFLENIIESKHLFSYFYLFCNDNSRLIPNKDVCKAFSKVFNEPNSRVNHYDYSNKVLINTQPFFELLGINIDLDIYKKIVQSLKEFGISVIIKSHPREKNRDRYNEIPEIVNDINYDISQEVLIGNSSVKPIAIIGFFSTSLITSNLFWGIPAISLGKLIDPDLIGDYAEDINTFITTFNQIVYAPKTLEEFQSIMREICDNGNNKKDL